MCMAVERLLGKRANAEVWLHMWNKSVRAAHVYSDSSHLWRCQPPSSLVFLATQVGSSLNTLEKTYFPR